MGVALGHLKRKKRQRELLTKVDACMCLLMARITTRKAVAAFHL